MKHLLPSYNLEWLEKKLTFSFSNKPSAPPPAAKPKKSVEEVEADDKRDADLRFEKSQEKKMSSAGKRRRRGKSLLISNDEKGLSDTLG